MHSISTLVHRLALATRLWVWAHRDRRSLDELSRLHRHHEGPASLFAAADDLQDALQQAHPQAARLSRRVSMVAFALLAASLGAAAVAYAAARAEVSTRFPHGYWAERLHERLRPALLDDSGRVLATVPLAAPGAGVVAAPHDTPAHCVQLVLLSEDRHWNSPWRHWAGLDLGGLWAAVRGERGGSTLPMQLARMLGDWRKDLSVWERKRLEMAAAADILALHDHDYPRLALTYLALAPMAIGPAGDINGLSALAAWAFGKPVGQLSLAECALAVTALRAPLVLKPGHPAADARWQTAAERADRLLTQFLEAGAEAAPVLTARRELQALRSAGPDARSAPVQAQGRSLAASLQSWIKREQP